MGFFSFLPFDTQRPIRVPTEWLDINWWLEFFWVLGDALFNPDGRTVHASLLTISPHADALEIKDALSCARKLWSLHRAFIPKLVPFFLQSDNRFFLSTQPRWIILSAQSITRHGLLFLFLGLCLHCLRFSILNHRCRVATNRVPPPPPSRVFSNTARPGLFDRLEETR